MRPPRRLAALALGGLVALLVLEAALRVALPAADAHRIWPPGLDVTLEAAPGVMPGLDGPARFRVNALGFRGPAPAPGDEVWVALGGSTTECLFLDEDETWTARLKSALEAGGRAPLAILNGGRSGRDMREHVLQLELLEVEADGVLLLAGVNDLLSRLEADAAYDPATHGADRERHLARAFAVRPPSDTGAPLWQRLAVVRAAVRLRDALDPDPRRLTQDPRGEVYTTWRAHRASASVVRAELPDLASALIEYRALLDRAADLCDDRGWHLAVATQPKLWRADLPAELEARLWMGWVGDARERPGGEVYAAGALAAGIEAYDDALRAFAVERGAVLLDLAALVPSDPRLFVDGVHVNEEGARAMAEAALASLGVTPLPPPRR